MPTLEEILASNSPDTLKKLLGRQSSEMPNANSSVIDALQSSSINAPPPVATVSAPATKSLSPAELAALSGPSSSQVAPSQGPMLANSISSIPPTKNPAITIKKSKTTPIVEDSDSDTEETPSENPLQAFMDAKKGFTNNTVENLKKVQDEANHEKLLADLQKGAALFGSGALGLQHNSAAPDVSNINALMDSRKKDADSKVTQFQDLADKEKDDPNSTYSLGMQAFSKPLLEKLGVNMPDNLSAAQMEKVSPLLVKMYDARQTDDTNQLKIQEMNETRRVHDQMLSGERADKNDIKQQLIIDKLTKNLKDDLDPNKARGGNFAKSQAVVNNADRLEGLFNQFPDNNIPKAQTTELATAVAAMISGGSPQSQHQIDMMVPDTMKGHASDIASWITGNPKGREQQKFMDMLHDTAKREKTIAINQVKNAQIQRLAAHQQLKTLAPDIYNSNLQAYDIDPNSIVNGRYKAANGKITVSNGNETLQIDKADLDHAKADGYNEVQ
jgi:hypothetical protein